MDLAADNLHNICAIDGCGKRVRARGWCGGHYRKWKAYGDPTAKRHASPGEPLLWLRDIAAVHQGDECLKWPFANSDGYGRLWVNGVSTHAHRIICTWANGPAPEEHDAAHSCGNGHLGCVNPRHLSWKSRSDNHFDKVDHGTDNRGEKHPFAKLTEGDVKKLRLLATEVSREELAKEFNVSTWTIDDVVSRKNWGWLD